MTLIHIRLINQMDESILLKIFKYINPLSLPECIIQNRLCLSDPKYNRFWKKKVAYDFNIESDMNIDWRDFWYWNRIHSKEALCKIFCEGGTRKFDTYLGILLINNKEKINIDEYIYNGFTIRYLIFQKGYIETIKLLRKDDFYATGSFNINNSIEKGHIEIVKLFLDDENLQKKFNLNGLFMSAVVHNQINIVKLFLENANVDSTYQNNDAIRIAASNGRTEIVKILLRDRRIDPMDQNNCALHMAIEKEHTSVVELLLADKRVNPSDNNNYAICKAIEKGFIIIVQLLLAHPAVDPADMDNKAIILASKLGHHRIVKLLLADKRVNPQAQNNRALTLAFEHNHSKVIQLLLEARTIHNPPIANHDNSDKEILEAATTGNIEIIKSLADNDMADSTIQTCIICALKNKHDEIAEFLLNLIVTPRLQVPPNGMNQIVDSINDDIIQLLSDNHIQIIQTLISNPKIDFESTSTHKKLIKHASENGHIEILRLILDSNTIYDEFIDLATKNGHTEIVKLFLSTKQLTHNNDAISIAAECGHIEIVKLLLADPCTNPSAKNNKAIRMAIANKRDKIVELLLMDSRINPAMIEKN